MKLYELAALYNDLITAIDNGDIPEEAINDTLEGIQLPLEEKLENTACLYKNLLAEAKALKDEEKSLSERRKSKEGQSQRLRDYLDSCFGSTGQTKFETPRCRLSYRKSESVSIIDEGLIPDEFFKIKKEVSKSDIKEALKSGVGVKGAELSVNQNLQIK